MVDDGFCASRANRALAAGGHALALEFPDLDYLERCVRGWAERRALTIGVWRLSPGTAETVLRWRTAAEHAQRPDGLAVVLVPDGCLAAMQEAAAAALPAQRYAEFAWVPAADLFLTDADIERCRGDAEPPLDPATVRERVGRWPELVPIETGAAATQGNVASAIRLILDSAALSPRRARFLRRCAVAEILTVSARDAVWPEPDRDELTRWAVDRGWIGRCDDPALLGVIPSRWRPVLLTALEQEEPGTAARLSRRLHELYLAHDAAPDILLRQAQRTGDEQLVAAVLSEHLVPLAAKDSSATVSALTSLPSRFFTAYPPFALARDLLGKAMDASGLRGRPRRQPAEKEQGRTPLIAAIRLMIGNRIGGRVHEAARNAADLRRIVEQPAGDGAYLTQGNTDLVLLHCGITALLDGDFAQARTDFEHACEVGGSKPGFVQRDALGKLALIDALQGELGAAETDLRKAASLPLFAKPFRTRALVAERLATALVAAERLDAPAVRQAWDSGWLKPARGEELWPFVLLIGQRCTSVLGTGMLSLQLADGMLQHAGAEPEEYRSVLARTVRAECLIALDSLAEAEACLGQIPARRSDQFSRLASARLALHADRGEQAVQLATALSLRAPSLAVRVEALFLGAAALWRLERRSRAVQCVRSATVAAEAQGMRLPMLAVPASVGSGLFPASGVTARPQYPDGAGLHRGPDLTPALRSVLAALASTGSTREIGEQLHLSLNTVKTHLRRLYRILGVHSRDDALAAAARLGLLG